MLPAPPDAPTRRLSRWGWFAVQVAIVLVVTVGGFEGSGRQFSLAIWAGLGVAFALMFTVFVTMSADWFRFSPPRDKLIWAALVVALTAVGGVAFILVAVQPGERISTAGGVWFPFVLAFPFSLAVWFIVGVNGLFRRPLQRGLPLVENEGRQALPIANRLGSEQSRK